MARIHDLIDSLGMGEDGLTAYPDTFTTDILSAYDEDLSIPSSKVAVLEADLAQALAEIERLKAHNYDLLTAVPAEPDTEPEPDEDDGDNDNNDSDEGVDALFGDKE